MADSGGVSPQIVVMVLTKVLGENCVQVQAGNLFVVTGDSPWVYRLSDPMTRKVVQAIANRHGVKVHFFYKPEMLHGDGGGTH